jgi:hypothetical protein
MFVKFAVVCIQYGDRVRAEATRPGKYSAQQLQSMEMQLEEADRTVLLQQRTRMAHVR